MPTMPLVFKHKAKEEGQTSKRAISDLTVICLWSILGLVFAMLTIRTGFAVDLVQFLATAG
jgi:hypothetical protein